LTAFTLFELTPLQDDSSNPFMPRVGSRLLPLPTPIRIRMFKAMNFIQQICTDLGKEDGKVECDNTISRGSAGHGSNPLSVTDERSPESLPMLSDAIQGAVGHHGTLSSDRLNRACNVVSLEDTDLVSGHYFSLQRHEAVQVADGRLLNPRGGETAFVDRDINHAALDLLNRDESRPVTPSAFSVYRRSMSLSIPVLTLSPSFERDCLVSEDLTHGREHECLSTENSDGVYHCVSNEAQNDPSRDVLNTGQGVVRTTESSQVISTRTPETDKRAVHRQARLIDGTVRISNVRKATTNCQTQSVSQTARSSVEHSPISTKSSRGRHNSWLYGLWNLVRNTEPYLFQISQRKSRSVLIPTKMASSDPKVVSSPHPSIAQNIARLAENSKYAQFSLDGATFDASSPDSKVNLNKPLPLNPEDMVKSMSSRTSTASPTTSFAPTSTASATSSPWSKASRKNGPGGAVQADASTSFNPGPYELAAIDEHQSSDHPNSDPKKSHRPPIS
jgi:hypothetical protein